MKGFISYAHDDIGTLRRLMTHVKATERKFENAGLSFWHDQRLRAGHDWNDKIAAAIQDAEVFLMLVSPEFIGSDYIFKMEIPAIKDRIETCHGMVVPIVVRDCAWELAAEKQAVPVFDGRLKPIEDWKPQNKGFDAVRDQIDQAIEDHFGIEPGGQIWPRR